jgi:hypothetical protein
MGEVCGILESNDCMVRVKYPDPHDSDVWNCGLSVRECERTFMNFSQPAFSRTPNEVVVWGRWRLAGSRDGWVRAQFGNVLLSSWQKSIMRVRWGVGEIQLRFRKPGPASWR